MGRAVVDAGVAVGWAVAVAGDEVVVAGGRVGRGSAGGVVGEGAADGGSAVAGSEVGGGAVGDTGDAGDGPGAQPAAPTRNSARANTTTGEIP